MGSCRKYYSLENVDVPRPTAHQALLKIHAAGMCHTDLLVMDNFPLATYPLTGSHEPAGEVVELGDLAKQDARVQVGDRVAGSFHMNPCCMFYPRPPFPRLRQATGQISRLTPQWSAQIAN